MRARTIMLRFCVVLISAALGVAPVAAFANICPPASSEMHEAMKSGGVPCDMPCKGCADGKASASCVAACMGLIAAMPAPEGVSLPATFVERSPIRAQRMALGTERQPDTPPPKPLLV